MTREIKHKSHPWKRQRLLKKEDIPVQAQILKLAYNYNDLKERALFILAYLTAGRISEIVRHNFLKKYKYATENIEDSNGNARVQLKKDPKNNPIVEKMDKIPLNYPGILKKNIIFTEMKGKRILIIDMQNRKNRKHTKKNIPIPIDKEREFIELLREYLNTLEDDDPLFDFSTSSARRILSKVRMNPHFLRDIRLTHLVTIYGFDTFQLVKFAGWSNIAPAEHYIRLGVHDLVDKF